MTKRIFYIFLLILVFSGELFSQGYQSASSDNDKTFFGIKAGINAPRLYYTNPHIKNLPHDLVIKPSLGIFLEFPLYRWLSVAAEFNYQNRGGATSYDYEQDYHVTYKLDAMYMSLRVPFYIYMPVSKKTAPYLMLGPDLGYAFGGNISLSQPGLDIPESSVNINDANYNPYYFGMLAGVGIRHKGNTKNYVCITKLDVALNWGFLDTFSKSEQNETAVPTNVHAYNHQGKRYSRGLEISLSIGFIRNEDMSACRDFR